MTRSFRAITVAMALLAPAAAYYPFVRYNTRGGPFVPVPDKFDVNALPNRTVPYFISSNGPDRLAAGDSVAALHSQIRLAAATWDGVETSALRIEFGGVVANPGSSQGPAIDVIFEDMPPGVIAYGGPTTRADAGPEGQFTPILRSQVALRRDMSNSTSWGESFFLTVVHEFGHALGLQHTFTSSVMSTSVTRGTTKSKPLASDDVAGVSWLYPTPAFLQNFGSVTGRITVNGQPLGMASVVALPPTGTAVSAITNPDGSYRIDGVPPGTYYIYVHPLPPPMLGEAYPGGMIPALDADRQMIPFSSPVETLFFPGVRDLARASTIEVRPGGLMEGINLNLAPRASVALYGVQTFSYPAQVAVRPGFLSPAWSRNFIVASGFGLNPNNQIPATFRAQVPSGATSVLSVRPYSVDARFVQFDMQFNPFASGGSNHLLFTLNNDLFVLPSAFQLVQRMSPQILAVDWAEPGRTAVITGSGLQADTRILFDGVAAVTRSFDEGNQRMVVVAPAMPPAHRAAVVAMNSDGQSSLFVQSVPPSLPAISAESPVVFFNPPMLPAGTEALLELTSVGVEFQEGLTQVHFGTPEIRVKKLWVTAPNRLMVNVAVSPNLPPTVIATTVVAGLHSIVVPGGFQVLPPIPTLMSVSSEWRVPGSDSSSVPVGSRVAAIQVQNLIINGGLQVFLGNTQLSITNIAAGSPSTVTVVLPAGLAAGPYVLRVVHGFEQSLPVVVEVDPPPPALLAVQLANGMQVDTGRPGRPGESLSLLVSGLATGPRPVSLGRVLIRVGGVDHYPTQVQSLNGGEVHRITFPLSLRMTPGVYPLTIRYDARQSAAVNLPVQSPGISGSEMEYWPEWEPAGGVGVPSGI